VKELLKMINIRLVIVKTKVVLLYGEVYGLHTFYL